MKNKVIRKTDFSAALLLMTGNLVSAQSLSKSHTPALENLKSRQEFQDNKDETFLHSGLQHTGTRRMVYAGTTRYAGMMLNM